MPQSTNKALKEASPYNAAITREQFLFYEMRTTAKLVNDGLDKDGKVCPEDGACLHPEA